MNAIKLLMLTAAMSCIGITSLCQRTTTIEDRYLQNGVKYIEKGKYDAQLVVVLTQKIDSLNRRIGFLDSARVEYKRNDFRQDSVMRTYEVELQNTRLQRDEAMIGAKKIDKLLRRQKRKTVFVGIGTAAVAVASYFLFLK